MKKKIIRDTKLFEDDLKVAAIYEQRIVPCSRIQDYGSGTITYDESMIYTEVSVVILEMFGIDIDITDNVPMDVMQKIVKHINGDIYE